MSREVLAFDCVGTVFDASGVPKDDLRSYVAQVRRPEWSPLVLPESFFALPAHPDSAEGIRRLREKYRVVTCSNLPLPILSYLSAVSGIEWDAIVPLEASRVYKPHAGAYQTVCLVMQCRPADVTIVSAHADGPDVKGAPAARMKFQLIRNPDCQQTIVELAEALGC